MALTGNRGVDVAIEAIGLPDTFDICQSVLAPGGHLANIGVHGTPVRLRLDTLWSRNITLTTRLVDGTSTVRLLQAVDRGTLDPRKLITHHFTLERILQAYEVFGHAMAEHALKVIISSPL